MMEYEIQDRRDDAVQFSTLNFLECFYIGDCNEPYIKVPDYSITTEIPIDLSQVSCAHDAECKFAELATSASHMRQFNALRIRTLQYIYIVPTNMVHKLQSKLVLATESASTVHSSSQVEALK